MTTPVTIVCGVAERPMHAATVSLQFTLPRAVVVRHEIDPDQARLTRTVSDLTGLVETGHVDLEHACVSCAIREDIVPTLERLAASGRWDSIVACLPVTAEPNQVCRVMTWSPLTAPHVHIAGVLTALDADRIVDDLLGPDLIADRGLQTSTDDGRGVAEVACAMVEYADLLCLTAQPDAESAALLGALARPGTPVLSDPSLLDESILLPGMHDSEAVESWVTEVRRAPLPSLPAGSVWRLDLRSDRPFHPERLRERATLLGGGPRRSRGCFWLPTRPRHIGAWDAAGGHVSVGAMHQWQPGHRPLTRLVVIGLDDGSAEIAAAFERCLLNDEEMATRGPYWEQVTDGLEAWLGPIGRAA